MCGKTVDSYLLALKFVPNWFVTNKMIDKLDNAIFSIDDTVFGDIDFDIVTSFRSDKGLNSISHHNINLDHENFDDYDPENINHVTLMVWYNRYKQH